MPQILPFYPTEVPPPPRYAQWLKNAGWTPTPFEPENALHHHAEALLMHTPVRVGDEFVQPEFVWQRYWRDHNPTLKIIETGLITQPPETRNYLNWYLLPDDFNYFLAHAQPVTAWIPIEPNAPNSLDEIWEKFWDGHNNNGFAHSFIWSASTISTVAHRLNVDRYNYLPRAKEYLQDPNFLELYTRFPARWKRYSPLLQTAPFANQVQQAGLHVTAAAGGWTDLNFNELAQTHSKILSLQQHFKQATEILENLAPFFKNR